MTMVYWEGRRTRRGLF